MKNTFVTLILLLVLFNTNFAQEIESTDKPLNLPQYFNNKLHFGFELGIISSSGILKNPLLQAKVNPLYGFNLNCISSYQLNQHFDVRIRPGLSFTAHDVQFTVEDNSANQIKASSTSMFTNLDLPIEIRCYPKRNSNLLPYISIGGIPSYLMAQDNTLFEYEGNYVPFYSIVPAYSNMNFMASTAIGMDIFRPRCKMSVNLRYLRSLNNISEFQDDLNLFESFNQHSLVLSVSFEG